MIFTDSLSQNDSRAMRLSCGYFPSVYRIDKLPRKLYQSWKKECHAKTLSRKVNAQSLCAFAWNKIWHISSGTKADKANFKLLPERSRKVKQLNKTIQSNSRLAIQITLILSIAISNSLCLVSLRRWHCAEDWYILDDESKDWFL